jgi:hypothetical protein
MLKGSEINRENLLSLLSEGFCKIQFRKATNGRFRSLICTLDQKSIPAKHAKSVAETIKGGDDPSLMPVFDVISKDWKSFYIPNILYLYTEDELRGNKSKNKGKNEKKGK